MARPHPSFLHRALHTIRQILKKLPHAWYAFHPVPIAPAAAVLLDHRDLLRRQRRPAAGAARCGRVHPRARLVLVRVLVLLAPRLVARGKRTAAAAAAAVGIRARAICAVLVRRAVIVGTLLARRGAVVFVHILAILAVAIVVDLRAPRALGRATGTTSSASAPLNAAAAAGRPGSCRPFPAGRHGGRERGGGGGRKEKGQQRVRLIVGWGASISSPGWRGMRHRHRSHCESRSGGGGRGGGGNRGDGHRGRSMCEARGWLGLSGGRADASSGSDGVVLVIRAGAPAKASASASASAAVRWLEWGLES
jgi:hypothetical protein